MIISGCASTCGVHPEDLTPAGGTSSVPLRGTPSPEGKAYMRQTVQRAIMGARNEFDSCVPRNGFFVLHSFLPLRKKRM